MRDANWNPRSHVFRPTRDLQFSEAAMQALREAERRRSGRPYRIAQQQRSERGWIVYAILLSLLFIVIRSFFSATQRAATPVRADVPEQVAVAQSASELEQRNRAQQVRTGTVISIDNTRTSDQSPQTEAVRRSAAPPVPAPRKIPAESSPYINNARRWRNAWALTPIPVYQEWNGSVNPIAVIEPGTYFLTVDAGYQCGRYGTWRYAFVPNWGEQQSLRGVICTFQPTTTQ